MVKKVHCAAPTKFMNIDKLEHLDRLELIDISDWSYDKLLANGLDVRFMICNPGAQYRVDNQLIRSMKNLEILVSPSTGTDHIDIGSLKNIKFSSLSDVPDFTKTITASAEFTFLLILISLRKVFESNDAVRNGHWREIEDKFRGSELSDKTVGIVGLGRNGRKVADWCSAFGANVIYFDPFLCKRHKTHVPVEIEEIAQRSDIVVVCPKLNSSSRNMISASFFDQIKSPITLINTSRGGVVNEEALITAIKNGKVARALFDVVEGEQTTNIHNNELVKFSLVDDRVFITPHIAGLTIESQTKAMNYSLKFIVENFHA